MITANAFLIGVSAFDWHNDNNLVMRHRWPVAARNDGIFASTTVIKQRKTTMRVANAILT